MIHPKIVGLNNKEKEVFKELKEKITREYGNEAVEDERIYRFLKARDFDITLSEAMLRKNLEWIASPRIQNLYNPNFKPNELVAANVKFTLISRSKEGNPVVYIDVGNPDIKGLVKSVATRDILDSLIHNVIEQEENLKPLSQKIGKSIHQWTAIFNFENFNISQILYKPNIEMFLEGFGLYEANFPERLKSAYMINTSKIFYTIFNIVKPLLSANTLGKVNIYGRDGWKEDLLEEIDENDLPVFLGGKKTGPNGNIYCNTLQIQGPIPKECYFRSTERRLKGQFGVKEFVLNRNMKTDICFNIDDTGSQIEWDFETEKGDISYGLYFRERFDNSSLENTIIAPRLINAHMQMETGVYICRKAGVYLLRFDNSHSWLREKHVFCKAYIVKPDGRKMLITH